MSISVKCNTKESLTFCDEAQFPNDDFIQPTINQSKSSKRRHTSLVKNDFETSTPRFSHHHHHHQSIDKENDSNLDRNDKKKSQSKALNMIFTENQSLIPSNVKLKNFEKKKKIKKNPSNCGKISFEIYHQENDHIEEKNFESFIDPVKNEENHFQLITKRKSSPEYEPTTFLDSITQSENQSIQQKLMEIFPESKSEPINDIIQSETNEIIMKEKIANANTKIVNRENFSIEKFLKLIPDPWKYFPDKDRDCTDYFNHSLHYLKINFRKYYNQTINDALSFHNQNLYLACKYLKKKNRGLKLRMSNRPMSECNLHKPTTINPQFDLEVLFIENEEKVKNYVKEQIIAKKFRMKEAARFGLLVECECCFGEDFLREDVVTCSAGHVFCKDCIIRYIEIGIGNGIGQVQCLGLCNEEYSIQIIWDILRPEMFSRLMETFQPFNYVDVIQCPFCDSFFYLSNDIKIAKCFNVKCLKEFCRFESWEI